VARTLIAWARAAARVPGVVLQPAEVNGDPGVLVLDGAQRLISVWALDSTGSEVIGVSSIVNPDKLAHLGPVADYNALRRSMK
jgi:RNA polymerase sigma-70 factor (ECF subfamily)